MIDKETVKQIEQISDLATKLIDGLPKKFANLEGMTKEDVKKLKEGIKASDLDGKLDEMHRQKAELNKVMEKFL